MNPELNGIETEVKFQRTYPDIWFKVIYDVKEYTFDFTVFKITGEIMSAPPEYELSPEPVMIGTMKWDGCMNFDYNETHYCGLHNAEWYFQLIKELYKVKNSIGGNFLKDKI